MDGVLVFSHEYAAVIAAELGQRSPCAKSKRGVVIWAASGEVLGSGFNAPPVPFQCDSSAVCRASCNKVAVHAEEAALLDALSRGRPVVGADLLHVKVVDGAAVPSGGPSCWQCSRAILQAGISGVWLLHADGWKRYPAVEFHRLTLDACGLPAPLPEEGHEPDKVQVTTRYTFTGGTPMTRERAAELGGLLAGALEACGEMPPGSVTMGPWTIGCDGEHEDDPPRIPLADPDEVAARGWVHRDEKDYCPLCAAGLDGEPSRVALADPEEIDLGAMVDAFGACPACQEVLWADVDSDNEVWDGDDAVCVACGWVGWWRCDGVNAEPQEERTPRVLSTAWPLVRPLHEYLVRRLADGADLPPEEPEEDLPVKEEPPPTRREVLLEARDDRERASLAWIMGPKEEESDG